MYEALFARFLIIGQQRNIQLLSVFQYELSPVPHSLVDEFGYLLGRQVCTDETFQKW